MEQLKKITLFLLMTLFVYNCLSQKNKKLAISGKVVNCDTKSIWLIKMGQDPRHDFDSIIKIPVKDGKFHYEAKIEYPEVVELALQESIEKGAFAYTLLFLENERMDLTIYNDENFDKNIIKGGGLNALFKKSKEDFEHKFNAKMKPIEDSIELLMNNEEYYSDSANILFKKLRKAKTRNEGLPLSNKVRELDKKGQLLSEKAKILDAKKSVIFDEQYKYMQDFVRKNTSIISYYFFIGHFLENKEKLDLNWAKTTWETLKKANPNHPYNELALNLINAIDNIQVGKHFVDFTAPDLKGNQIKLSDKINGKVALLDLWATWCGSCIRQSRSILPVYDEYKDKGFTVVGVAGEFKNTKNLEKFFEKNKWPWLQLVDLDRKYKIWNKYGIDNAGGATFLIDENGIILSKNPTAEEVRKELKKRLD